jgi:hypothetical protein
MSSLRRAFRSSSLAIVLVACSASPEEAAQPQPTSSVRDPFVAFSDDFKGFHAWEKMFIPAGELDDPIHGGNRSIYVNKRPAKGSKEFPVGTIIVKQMQDPGGQTFAMVKRGGGFNADGAVGWEWFRLVEQSGGVWIAWRGVGPPDGETYGGASGGVCNGCHFAGKDNDWVQYEGLKL